MGVLINLFPFNSRTYYFLTSAGNDHLLDLDTESGTPWCINMPYISEREQQCWSFVLPKVAFPCGWFQIQNLETGALLSHTYLSNPPVLSSPPHTVLPTQQRESWHTQWTSVQVQSYSPDYVCTTGPNTWCIKNRLTNAFLGSTKDGIFTWESDLLSIGSNKFKTGICIPEYCWKLDLGLDRSWKIINHSTLCLLEGLLESSTGIEVACISKNFARNKSWLLKYVSTLFPTQ